MVRFWGGLAAGMTALAIAGAVAAPAGAEDLVVDGGRGAVCADARNGLVDVLGTPYCSIAAAVGDAPAGSTVVVQGGRYDRAELTGVHRDPPVTVRAASRATPEVDGLRMDDVSGLVVAGLTFTNGVDARGLSGVGFLDNTVRLTAKGSRTGSAFVIVGADGLLVQGNDVTGGRDGVNLVKSDPPASGVAVVGNHFQGQGGDAVHLNPGQHDVYIARNVIEDVYARPGVDATVHSDGLQALGPLRDVQVVSNFISGGRGLLFMLSPKFESEGGTSDRILIANNVLTGRQFGIRLYSTRDAKVVNNTVWGTSDGPRTGLDVHDRQAKGGRTTGMVLVNNLVKRLDVDDGVGFARRDRNLVADGPLAGPGDVRGTPEFADLASGDLRLRSGSPGVDAGDATVAPVVDFLGLGRLGLPDIGAFEVGGTKLPVARTTPAPTPPPVQQALPPVVDEFLVAPSDVSDRTSSMPRIALTPGTLGGPGAATLGWRTSTPGLAFIRLDRWFDGRRRKGVCVPAARARRGGASCAGARFAGVLVRPAPVGVMTTALTARFDGRALRKGTYTATIVLLDAAGQASAPRAVKFRVTS